MNVIDRDELRASGVAPVDGLALYYESHGSGTPLLYIPPVFGHAGTRDGDRRHDEFPLLASIRRITTVDVQGHGRTPDIDRPLAFERHADDVVALLDHLGIERVDLFGESFGGVVAMLAALRHPHRVRRVATYASPFAPFATAMKPEMLANNLSNTPDARGIRFQREQYEAVAPDPRYWPTIWRKVAAMRFDGLTNDELAAIEAPVLVALGDHDFVTLEQAIRAFRALPNGQLAVIPDAGHFVLNADPQKLEPILAKFFDEPDERAPFGTTATGYQPGETR